MIDALVYLGLGALAVFLMGKNTITPATQPADTMPAASGQPEDPADDFSVLNLSGAPGIDRWRNLVKSTAATYGIPPAILMGILKCESSGDPNTVREEPALTAKHGRRVASVGLFQVLNTTAEELEPDITFNDLFDPAVSARLAGKYLAKQIRRYNGNIRLWVSAYNAGTPRRATDGKFIFNEAAYHGELLKNERYVKCVLDFARAVSD